jgi:L-ascorbate metabolism protein UlaG (beta-lactamase superfamily)
MEKRKLKSRMTSFIISLAVIGFILYSTNCFTTFGVRANGRRLDRIKLSPNYKNGTFTNSIPTQLGLESGSTWNMLNRWIFGKEERVPKREIPVIPLRPEAFKPLSPDDLWVTWFGHSTLLIEIDGYRILTDPVWSKWASPLKFIGPARFFPPPLPLDDLPPLDAVLISHDHYDHLDMATIKKLAQRGVSFIVPLGVGAHLEHWNVPVEQIIELDWWQTIQLPDSEIKIVATPARHFSGRLFKRNPTLWASFAILGPKHRAYFGGDSGMFPGYKTIGQKYGPFDLTCMKIGAYDRNWPEIHLNPEQAVQAHLDLNGDRMLPIHWATFNLAFHAWNEPILRMAKAAEQNNMTWLAPRPGEIVEPSSFISDTIWWE